MGKQIQSPVKRFPGYVVLPDALDWEQIITWDESIDVAQGASDILHIMQAHARGILAIVEDWHIEGIEQHPAKLPATPVKSAGALVRWLTAEINAMIAEDKDDDLFLSAD